MTDLVPIPPGTAATPEQLIEAVEFWLENKQYIKNTADPYRRSARRWLRWCHERGLNPLTVKFTHVNMFRADLALTLQPRSINQALTAISQWYGFLHKVGAIPTNPASLADRPHVDPEESPTLSMDLEEVYRFLKAARRHSAIAESIFTLMADLTPRVSTVCALDTDSLGYERGGRYIEFVGKRSKVRRRPLEPETAEPLDRYLAERAAEEGVKVAELTGPLFVWKGERISRFTVYRLFKELVEAAGLPNADLLYPHSLKAAFITNSRELGVSQEDRQEAADHTDPRTTAGYDKRRHARERHPVHALIAWRVERRRSESK